MLNYLGQGALLLARSGGARSASPFFLLAPEKPAAAAGHPRDAGDDHRQPGGDLRRLLGRPSRRSSSASCRGCASTTPARRRAGQIYIPLVNWALMMMVLLLVLIFQTSSQPRRRLWHRGDRRDVHRHLPARRSCCSTLWKWNEAARAAAARACSSSSTSPISPSNLTKVPDGGWFPLLVGFDHLHPADDLGEGPPADDRAAARGGDADQDVHQIRRRTRRRACRAPRCS